MASSMVNLSKSAIAICMVSSITVLVFGRAGAERADERPAHGFCGAVSAAAGGLLNPVRGVLEPAPGRLEPDPVHVPPGRHADLGGERPGELARRQAGPG